MLKFFKLHFIAFLISITFAILLLFLVPPTKIVKVNQKNLISSQAKTSGVLHNLNSEDNDVSDFFSSIKNKNQLTLFGSSEFNSSLYATYRFLPDTMNRQVLGIGHAHHQHLSILIELLASDKFIDSSEICIFLSPGWFQGSGTNSSAFIEFAKPELLKRIITGSVKDEYKIHIGRYLNLNHDQFESFSKEHSFLSDLELASQGSSWFNLKQRLIKRMQNVVGYNYSVDEINYNFKLKHLTESDWSGDLNEITNNTKETFLKSVTNNSLYVYDEYYSKYLIDTNGIERSSKIDSIDIVNNEEYKDFKLVIKYLKEKYIKSSFIILPLNPYYYKNIELLNPLMDSIKTNLENENIPYYDMFVSSKEDYDPGTLMDVMHLGDYGWMKVNKYIDSLYYGN